MILFMKLSGPISGRAFWSSRCRNYCSSWSQTTKGSLGCTSLQVAIDSVEGTKTMFSVDPRPGDPEWVVQLTSFYRDVVMEHSNSLPELESRIFTVEVKSRTVASLIAEVGLATVDLLHIDAEGFDDQIIRSLPLTAPWAPQFLIFEMMHLSSTRYIEVKELLTHADYKVVNLWPDELAYRDPSFR